MSLPSLSSNEKIMIMLNQYYDHIYFWLLLRRDFSNLSNILKKCTIFFDVIFHIFGDIFPCSVTFNLSLCSMAPSDHHAFLNFNLPLQNVQHPLLQLLNILPPTITLIPSQIMMNIDCIHLRWKSCLSTTYYTSYPLTYSI